MEIDRDRVRRARDLPTHIHRDRGRDTEHAREGGRKWTREETKL